MIEQIQDEELAKDDIRRQERLASERSPWEETWREVDERFPHGAGGFDKRTQGQIRGARNYDSTHITAIERFAAAGVAITTPEEKDYIKPFFLDDELNKLDSVKQWRWRTGRRLYAIRHAAHTGFGIAVNEDWDQLGRYGTSAVWQEKLPGDSGIFYRTLHLSEVFIDTNFAGLVDTVHRQFERTARELEQQFGREALTEKMREALTDPAKQDTKFTILHVVIPNTSYDPEKLDFRRFPIVSRYLATDEKIYLRRRGYTTMPVSVSRHMTSPGEKYGRSPAIKVMPNIQGVNVMKADTYRAGKKAVDPALIFNDDMGLTSIKTKPGGLNAGLVDDAGRPLIHRMPGGEGGIPYALEMVQDERETIKGAFLEEFYKILTDPNSRMTTTEVLEVMSKQGILVRPYASRYATEKQHPMTQRDLDLAMRAGQVDELPPEAREAGAWPLVDYENPLAAMARAESTAKSMRFVEYATQVVTLDQSPAGVHVDTAAMLRGGAEEIGVRPDYIRSEEQVAEILRERAEQEQAAVAAEELQKTAGAFKDIAQGNAIAEGV